MHLTISRGTIYDQFKQQLNTKREQLTEETTQ